MSAPVMVFSCRRSSDVTRCSTPGCGGIAGIPCLFKLRGRLEGKTYGRLLCVKCSADKQLCPPHVRLTATL